MFKKLFGRPNFSLLIKKINSLEPTLEKLSDSELKAKNEELKNKFQASGLKEDFLPDAFALIREVSKRTLKQRHFDVQLMGGIALSRGQISEMLTGEGKTLAATAPAYFHALTKKGVHIITVNDYLARRDTVWMGQIYDFLGLKVGCLCHETAFIYDPAYKQETNPELDKERDVLGGFKIFHEFLRPVSRQEAYRADIVYGTNHEFGFDYLRDNLAYSRSQQTQRKHYYAIIDEIDSILIDESRTPLIIAAPDLESSDFYRKFARIVSYLKENEDYTIDEKSKSVQITNAGIDKVEEMTKIQNFYAPENFRLVHYLEESLKAKTLFHRDKDYLINDGQILIIDEFTGRVLLGRRYSGGLHQAIEAKEGVIVQPESRTFAQITLQNYFRLYEKISGMTGTAQTSAEEFHKVYNLETVSIPSNKPMIRKNLPDLIYKTKMAKYKAVIEEIKDRYSAGQPILVGTTSVEQNEIFSKLLTAAGIPHEVLNAKNHEREGEIIAQAGKLKAVTVATNMAGRGVDIILGGNPSTPEEAQKIKDLGGLHIIGTERHEARRIDDQLRGRSGRQGDPGSSRFFLSLEDDLMRIFGGDRVRNLMSVLKISEDHPIESKMISKVVTEAQKKVEGFNFDLRKHLLEYDDVLNKQRNAIYKKRQEILEKMSENKADDILEELLTDDESNIPDNSIDQASQQVTPPKVKPEVLEKIKTFNNEQKNILCQKILSVLDMLWMSHLENLEALSESVRIRAYGQKDPLVEYKYESRGLFKDLLDNFKNSIKQNIEQLI
ncbi:MAG: preprotein translocase subunit SecA [Candidatus Paceibacterota bacterium]|jgi:preprotein translocase subunit SecA